MATNDSNMKGLKTELDYLKSATNEFKKSQASYDMLKSLYAGVTTNKELYSSSDFDMDEYAAIVGDADRAIKNAERGMTGAGGVPFYKRLIPAVSAAAATALVLGVIGYGTIEAHKEKARNAKTELTVAKSKIDELTPDAGTVKMLPKEKRSDGEYFFSSDEEGDTSFMAAQARPNGAYRFMGIDIDESSWYFGVTSNGDMHLCINLEPYNFEERQELIKAAKKSGFAFSFMENAEGTGKYTLVVNNIGDGYSLEVTNTERAGELSLSGKENDLMSDMLRARANRARQKAERTAAGMDPQ